MSAFEAALAELNNRTTAVASLEPDTKATVVEVQGHPDELIRRLLSGYVQPEDTNRVMNFAGGVARNVTKTLMAAESHAALQAGLRFTIAQMMLLGVAMGRQDAAAD